MSCAFSRLRPLGRLLSSLFTSNGQNIMAHSLTAASLEMAQVRLWSTSTGCATLLRSAVQLPMVDPFCRDQGWFLELQPARK